MNNNLCENKEDSAYAKYMRNAELKYKNYQLLSADSLFNLAVDIDNAIKAQEALVEKMKLVLAAARSPEIKGSEELKNEYVDVESFILRAADGFYYRNNIINALASMSFKELENSLRPKSLRESRDNEHSTSDRLASYIMGKGATKVASVNIYPCDKSIEIEGSTFISESDAPNFNYILKYLAKAINKESLPFIYSICRDPKHDSGFYFAAEIRVYYENEEISKLCSSDNIK